MNGDTGTWRFFRAGGFDQVRLDTFGDLLRIDELDQKLWVALSCPINGIDFDKRTLEFIDSDLDGHIRPPELIEAIRWTGSRLTDQAISLKSNQTLQISAIKSDDEEGDLLYRTAMALASDLGKNESDCLTVEETGNALEIQLSKLLQGWESEGEGLKFLGDETQLAFEALQSIAAKVDDYFLRCHVIAYQAEAISALNPSMDDFKAISNASLRSDLTALSDFPLACAASKANLPLRDGCNPAWMDAMQAFHQRVVVPILGDTEFLDQDNWNVIKQAFVEYAAWLDRKPGYDAVQDGTHNLEKLARYVRDLLPLANNFIAFKDFYTDRANATFQLGTLFLDGRSSDLCVAADDVARHEALAKLSGMYLIYCICTRGDKKMRIAAAITAGDSDQLILGRNGIFYDRQGQDWDATIVHILDNPISLRQAFWSPYKNAVRLLSDQLQKLAASKAKSSQAGMSASIAQASNKLDVRSGVSNAPTAPAPTFDAGRFAGIFAAIGLAVGALGTALASVVTGLFTLRWWQLPIAVLGALLVISGPSVIIAWFKLRNRSLGPILDANGWAINARVRVNIPFGSALTQTAKLPTGAERSLIDPYAEKTPRWPWAVLLIVVAASGCFAWFFLCKK